MIRRRDTAGPQRMTGIKINSEQLASIPGLTGFV